MDPPVPRDGRCVCRAPLWFVRPQRIGEDGHFECRRCRRRFAESRPWTPQADAPSDP